LDYGCGSGILSIAALHMGARHTIGIDVKSEILVTTERNLILNEYDGRFEEFHTRETVPHSFGPGVDICIANIRVGQLVQSSMVVAILSNLAIGGCLCLSGIRPEEVEALKRAYGGSIEWLDEFYAEQASVDCPGSLESYGFDTGSWARLVGKHMGTGKTLDDDIRGMSEDAVS